jgi:16S rRNA processing protein RimM
VTPPALPPAREGRLVVGLVRGVQGLRGTVRVEVLSDEPARFEPGSILHPEDSEDTLTIAAVRRDGPGLLVGFAEVTDRNAADALRDVYLEADVTAVPLPEGTYYWHDIVGCRVESTDGEVLGEVEDVFRVGEAEVYVVRGERGELLVPAVGGMVIELAPQQKRMVVDRASLGIDG